MSFWCRGVAALAGFLLLFGCDDSAPPPGGDVGVGGEGGTPMELGPLCEESCSILSACTDLYESESACLQECAGFSAPIPLLEECVSCLSSVECGGARFACRQGVACDMAFDLHVQGVELGLYEGRKARVIVAEAFEGEFWADFARDTVVRGGVFDVKLVGALPAWNVPFDVVVLIDADGDGACDPTRDFTWRRQVGLPTANAHFIARGSDDRTPEACGFWDAAPTEIVLAGEGLDEWEGQWVFGSSVWVDESFLSVSRLLGRQIQQGAFRMSLGDFGDYVEEMAPNSELGLAWMVDLDGDWLCSEADAGGYAKRPPLEGLEQRVLVDSFEPGTAPCELLPALSPDGPGVPLPK